MNYQLSLKEARKLLGMSQQALAEDLGLTQAAISRYESGTLEPCKRIRKHMALYFSEFECDDLPLEIVWTDGD
jgi:transcriptional regulator with XRE-family HTH domain